MYGTNVSKMSDNFWGKQRVTKHQTFVELASDKRDY